ncbi:MAG: hypothetical protein ACI4OJ_10995 [Lachnospiraceae bacterium]
MGKRKHTGQAGKFWTGSRGLALAASLAALVCLLGTLFFCRQLYSVDYGQYENYFPDLSITWTQEDQAAGNLQYSRAVTTFRWTHFSWMKLFTPSESGALVYGVSLVRLFAEPLGIPLSLDALSVVWSLLLCVCVYVITRALAEHPGTRGVCGIPAVFFCLLFTDGNFMAMLRSLYPQGSAVVFTLLYASSILWILMKKSFGTGPLLCTTVLGVIFLKAVSPFFVFLPFVLLWEGYALVGWWRRDGERRALVPVMAIVITLTGAEGALLADGKDPDYFSEAARYESVFTEALTFADANLQRQCLQELGLDESYQQDIGKSYYDAGDTFAHDPKDTEEAKELFSKLSPVGALSVYLRHPELAVRLLNHFPEPGDSYESVRNQTLTAAETESGAVYGYRVGSGILGFVRKLLPYSWKSLAVLSLAFFAVSLMQAIRKRRFLYVIGGLAAVCAAAYFPAAVILNGYGLASQTILPLVFFQDLTAIALGTWLPFPVRKLQRWMMVHSSAGEKERSGVKARKADLLTGRSCVQETKKSRWVRLQRRFPKEKLLSRKVITVCTAAMGAVMLLCCYGTPHHPGMVNNGDFGRMMDQLLLTWTSDLYYDSDAQVLHQVIEQYVWDQPFSALKLTPLSPTYTLYFFSSFLRIFSGLTGGIFSTYGMAVWMSLVTLVCITGITWDLFPCLKRWSLVLGILLNAMLMCETYLVWYNSLFGETTILLGLVLSIYCGIHIAVMPKKGFWKRFLWFFLLLLSLYILIGSKAQMFVSAPVAIVFFVVLLLHHLPYRYDLRVLLGVAAAASLVFFLYGAVGIYRSDRTSDSTSEKHTLWQAYFYGILMISDDPIGDMEEAGIDTAMAPDIGKYVDFSNDENYVYAPLSEEAQKAFYDHVSVGTILKWYVTHPTKLLYMLDRAASESHELYNSFRVYLGQDYSDPNHDTVDGMGLWLYWRPFFTPRHFFGYVALYLIMLIFLMRRALNRDQTEEARRARLLAWGLLFVMFTGVLQYPLSVLGNGFADNQKQLFCFATTYDFLLIGCLVYSVRWLWRHGFRDAADAALEKAAAKKRIAKYARGIFRSPMK